ncbi:MAG TPA: M1 family metallopeptidase [Thermoanaerobaculia bacterium]|nr:M1 family metallopeptidase [Thermoanaerobaculia bacterium]
MRRLAPLLLFFFALPLLGQRLSPDVRPSHYAIALDIDIDGRHFSGEETIDVTTTREMSTIALNSLGLTISRASIDDAAATVATNEADEQITLTASKPLAAGAHRIALAWSAPLSDTKLQGLYVSKSPRRAYAVTQFEGTYARMMFPSFDEPAFKATFDLSVVIAKGDTAISNGAIATDVAAGAGRHRVTFATSPKMSTYLLALAVGDFKCASATEDGVPLRVCAVPEKLDEAPLALDSARAAVRFYQKWFATPYPFGKLDLVAIPDYEWGGMENTASIFFRESALLIGKNPSGSSKQSLAGLVAHEIAHQWFGDLVTAQWWDDIWLNEGFATWMATKPVAAWHPEWPAVEEAARATQGAIAVDSLGATRAIHATASTPGEIKEMFDGIAYEKGAALLRMLENYVGADAFRNGVNAYLRAHAFGNATSGDFADALAKASGKPIDEILRTFVMQPGVPLVTFARTCEKLTLTQRRFTLSDSPPAQQLWSIPICMRIGDATQCVLLDTPSASLDMPSCAAVYGNANALGYYRSSYAPWDLSTLARMPLTTPERLALIEDAWAGVRAGRTAISPFLDVAAQLASVRERVVITSLASKLAFIRNGLLDEPRDVAKFDRWIREHFPRVDWTPSANDSDNQRLLRATLLRVLGTAGDPSAVAAARRIVLSGSKDTALLEAAFDVASHRGDVALYEELTKRLAKTSDTQEHYRLLYALTDFSQTELAARTIALVETPTVRVNDLPSFFAELLSNPATRDAAWTYLKEHWTDLRTKVTSFGGRGAIPALGSACSANFRTDVATFFATHPAPGAERAVAQSLEQIDACLTMRERYAGEVRAWVRE